MKSRKIILNVIMLSFLLLLGKLCFSYAKSVIKKEMPSTVHFQPPVKTYPKVVADTNIIGIWKSEEDEDWQLKFLRNGTCINIYTGTPLDTSRYIFSTTSPQCGITVPVDQYSWYLKLTNLADSTDTQCYNFNGTTDSTLSITPIENHKIFMFKKQP